MFRRARHVVTEIERTNEAARLGGQNHIYDRQAPNMYGPF